MAQIGKLHYDVHDNTGTALSSVSVEVRKQGATVSGNQSGTTPLTITVNTSGAIDSTDTVVIDTGTTSYSVDSITTTTVVVSGFAGTLAVTDDQRLSPTTNLPTLYNDVVSAESKSNPLTTDSNGNVEAWLPQGPYDLHISGGSATTTLITDWNIVTAATTQDVYNIKDAQYGAVGDASADDTAAIQTAIDDAEVKGGTVYFPQGRYKVTSTITWRSGVDLEGGKGGGTGASDFNIIYPTILWGGSSGGTVITGEDIGGNWQYNQMRRLRISGNGANTAAILVDLSNRLDRYSQFDDCNFHFSTSDGIRLGSSAGMMNVHFTNCDWDAVDGWGINIDANTAISTHFSLNECNWAGSANVPKGFLNMDGSTASNNIVNQLSISNCQLEAQGDGVASPFNLINLQNNPTISNQIQYHVDLQNILIVGLSAQASAHAMVGFSSNSQDNANLVMINCKIGGTDSLLIRNGATAGPVANKLHPFVVFAPFNLDGGSPIGAETSIDFIGDVMHTAGRTLKPFLTFTDGDLTPSVALGENFKVINTSADSITFFDDGQDGQTIHLLFTTANTTLVDGSTLRLDGSTNKTFGVDDMISLLFDGTNWHQLAPSSTN